MSEIREGDGCEPRAVDAVLVKCVRRHLHRDNLDLAATHAREEGLQIGRFGRGVLHRYDRAVDPAFDRPDDSHAITIGPADRLEQIRRAGLPVGASHAEDAQRA